ncbi:hypothetical protein UlMin_029427 [Ulmus minor]
MSLRPRKPSQPAMHKQEEEHPVLKIHKRRWRLAFTTIYCTRALASVSRKVLQNKTRLLRSISYIAIDVQPPSGNYNKKLSFHNIDQETLSHMVREKNLESLEQFGGVENLALILETDVKSGIGGGDSDVTSRKSVFGGNSYPKPAAKGFFSFVFDAFKDTTILILFACAVLSLAFGIKRNGMEDGWFDGGSTIIAIFVVVVVSAVSNFKLSRQFEKLSNKSSDIRVEVVRDGRRHAVSIFDIVVGDVVCLKVGDQIPADGLFLEGHSVKIDHVEIGSSNPFLLSTTKVTDGFGSMLVTSVGMNTSWGEMMRSISRDLDEETPLQARLNKLTSYIGKVGLLVAALVLSVLMIRYFTRNNTNEKGEREDNGSNTKLDDIMNAVFELEANIVVVAIIEGRPLAVTLTLAYSMEKMMKDNAMVKKLSACETMGSATVICTDKTGTLTLNEMKVTEFLLGKETMREDSSSEMAPTVLRLLQEAVGLNTSGSVYKPSTVSVPEISGSPTEKAILSWAVFGLGMDIDEVKQQCMTIQVEAFNSETKRSGVLIRKNGEEATQSHWKGAAEMILAMCSSYYDRDGNTRELDDEERATIEKIIQNMASKSVRCVAFAHKKLENKEVHKKLEETGLTLLGLVGLKDPCRPGVRALVDSCTAAGVTIKMITGDNVHTARAIAVECGILNPDGDVDSEAVVEGIEFRNYSPEERSEKVEKIRVMARSSPFDKLLMIQCLKQKGHVVAVTGDGTNDASALKEADIGLSMGIQGTEVAKESSDIVILDDNFTSVVTVLRWGRCVYNNIQKFIQFQLTVNVAALFINFVASVSSGKVPLTAVQLLWVNLIMDTLGALALATDQPTNELMEKPPVGRTEPLITKVMWRNIIAHALYQVAVFLVLQIKGRSIFGVTETVKNTIIFNTFVFCQLFNEFNARKLEKNIFEGLHKNKLFMAIITITIVLQLVMVEFLKKFANTERLNWGQWGACIGIAALSWPIGWLVKCIPVSMDQVRARLQTFSA